LKPQIIERRTVWAGYLTIERLRIRLNDGAEVWREVEQHGNAVAVLPYSVERRCALLVRLFRAPPFAAAGVEFLEEACAGMIDHTELPETAVRREAQEELGVTLGSLEFVARVWPSAGVSTERHALFLAPYVRTDITGSGGGLAEEHENITVVQRPLADLAAASDQGRIEDAKLLTLVLALRLRRPELFCSGA
jgi:nudix-type nucleoside diphosphatase (YffH/AdpP family)